jgi:hypothetical protein
MSMQGCLGDVHLGLLRLLGSEVLASAEQRVADRSGGMIAVLGTCRHAKIRAIRHMHGIVHACPQGLGDLAGGSQPPEAVSVGGEPVNPVPQGHALLTGQSL